MGNLNKVNKALGCDKWLRVIAEGMPLGDDGAWDFWKQEEEGNEGDGPFNNC